jgi:hypothetical protein
MAKSKRKRVPKTVLKLPDLEQSKSAVLNSLTSSSSKRSYDHAIREFIDWYCSEPRLAFNRTVVTRYRIALEQHPYAPSTTARLVELKAPAERNEAIEQKNPGLANTLTSLQFQGETTTLEFGTSDALPKPCWL